MAAKTKTEARTWACDRCGAVMIELRCKLWCGNCGFMRDCGDP